MINWLNMQSKPSTHCTAQSHSWSSEESKAHFPPLSQGAVKESRKPFNYRWMEVRERERERGRMGKDRVRFKFLEFFSHVLKLEATTASPGKACVLKCLLAIHKIFRENDPAYILNDLYITDYCIWIQRVKSKHVLALAESLHNTKLQKNHLDLELELLEQAAELVVKEEAEEEEEEDSSSGSDSEGEEESEDEQPEERTENNQTGLRPLEPQVSCEVLKVDAVTEASLLRVELQPGGGEPREPRRLIEELGERLEAGLTIQEDVPRERRSISGSNTEGERESEGDYYHQCAADTERDTSKAATSRELLDPCLQRNPLRIISNDELDSDDDGDLLLTVGKEGP